MGDVVFRVFQCLNSDCDRLIAVRDDEIVPGFRFPCPECGFDHADGRSTKAFDYRLEDRRTDAVLDHGDFSILHDEYVRESHHFKYCLLCYTLKPVQLFDRHTSRKSGRQGECRLCKTLYNRLKNPSRLTDQHREAAQRRRLFGLLGRQSGQIDSRAVFEKFGRACFKCEKVLAATALTSREAHIDHTLPARLLWPVSTENATLLCAKCNGRKRDKWPSEFYEDEQLRTLARLTGYRYDLLAGPPCVNEDAVVEIAEDPVSFVEEWIDRPEDIRRIRTLIRGYTNTDILDALSPVPDYLLESGERKDTKT